MINDSNGDKILQLQDNGMFRSRRVRVDLDNWADYVFEKDYVLMPLSEVEKYMGIKDIYQIFHLLKKLMKMD